MIKSISCNNVLLREVLHIVEKLSCKNNRSVILPRTCIWASISNLTPLYFTVLFTFLRFLPPITFDCRLFPFLRDFLKALPFYGILINVEFFNALCAFESYFWFYALITFTNEYVVLQTSTWWIVYYALCKYWRQEVSGISLCSCACKLVTLSLSKFVRFPYMSRDSSPLNLCIEVHIARCDWA